MNAPSELPDDTVETQPGQLLDINNLPHLVGKRFSVKLTTQQLNGGFSFTANPEKEAALVTKTGTVTCDSRGYVLAIDGTSVGFPLTNENIAAFTIVPLDE